MRQEVRFCTAPDGLRIAFAIRGRGPLLARTPTWLTHLELDRESPIWRHVRTVERHLSNVYAKLRVSGNAARSAAAAGFSRSREQPPLRG